MRRGGPPASGSGKRPTVRDDDNGDASPQEQEPLERVTPRVYKHTARVAEVHAKPIYGLLWNMVDLRHARCFATVGANRAHVYDAGLPPDCELRLLQAFVDEDEDEHLYTLAWSLDENKGTPLLAVAGERGVIRVLDCHKGERCRTLLGHGHAINDLKVCLKRPSLLYSASKDEAIRVWSLRTGVCIMILAGAGGHRNEVLSCDVHPSGMRLASCGMDNTVCVWELERHEEQIQRAADFEGETGAFDTRFVPYADYSTHRVHSNYVDCVRWVGDLLLTKSVDSKILMWRPVFEPRPAPQPPAWIADSEGLSTAMPPHPYGQGDMELLQSYVFSDCSIWYMRFGLDFGCNTLAVGTVDGRVYVWDVRASPPSTAIKLSLPRCKRPVRMVAPSFDGRMLIVCADNGCIYRFDDRSVLEDGSAADSGSDD